MKRKAYTYLLQWKERPGRKPLVIRGARQVGKSYLVEDFARKEFKKHLTINAERDREFLQMILHEPPDRMIQLIELEYGIRLKPGNTLLFIDEIQEVPGVFARLRYFYEEYPDLHIIAAGSLLDFALEKHSFSMPVGRIEYLYLGPMTFNEFLDATDNEQWNHFMEEYNYNDQIPDTAHKTLSILFRTFLTLGGMPEVVRTYVQTKSLLEGDRIKETILSTLRDDFNKYGEYVNYDRIRIVFNRLPGLVGRKFKYVNISRDIAAREIKRSLHLLELARLIYRVRHSSSSGIPLGAHAREDSFKILFLDVGLLLRACDLSADIVQREPDVMFVNEGALAEQIIGQHLLYARPFWETPELYYWAREKPSSSAEVDYVLAHGASIIPVEVKSGKTGTLRSLWQFVNTRKSSLALRFNTDKPSLLNITENSSDIVKTPCRLLSLPLYLVEHTKRLLNQLDQL